MADEFVAHLRPPAAYLAEAEPAAWLWQKLREIAPEAIACALMPTHLHLLVRHATLTLIRFQRLLAQFGRRFDIPAPWLEIPEPRTYATKDKVLRQLRYIHLNPCRPSRVGSGEIQLVRDPLLWEWSTHRDLVGAIADPWVTPESLAPLREADPTWWHHYVSADPHVKVTGTPMPEPVGSRVRAIHPIDRIVRAAAAATRSSPDEIGRRGPVRTAFLDLALDQGWTSNMQLADMAGCCAETIRLHKRKQDDVVLRAARLCLGDDRLLARTSFVLNGAGVSAWRRRPANLGKPQIEHG